MFFFLVICTLVLFETSIWAHFLLRMTYLNLQNSYFTGNYDLDHFFHQDFGLYMVLYIVLN